MTSVPSRSLFTRTARFLAGALFALTLGHGAIAASNDVSASAMSQISSLLAEKASRTPAQQKMDSQLVYLVAQTKGQAISAVQNLQVGVSADKGGRVLVDIKGTVSDDLLDYISQLGGAVKSSFARWNAIRASLPIDAIEALAGRDDVRFVAPAAQATTNVGGAVTEGDRTHRADTARANFLTKGGNGVKVGVLSDGSDSLATSITSGDLNADTTVLQGQAGAGNEGTAMMQIVQDLAPNAKIYYATAFNGPSSFAANIIALKNAGCTVIVDDVSYFNESPFQDGVISQAVNTVSAAGVLYFSSARNSGSLDYGNSTTFGGGGGTSGTWEGDWADSGTVTTLGTKGGNLHNFGGGVTANIIAAGNPNAGSEGRVDFFWSDPAGASTNDYDVFLLNSSGTVIGSSTNIQNGSQDPYEQISPGTGDTPVGQKIVIVKMAAAAPRFLHLDVGRRYLTIGTAGNVRGHNAAGAANAFSVAATRVSNSPNSGLTPYFVGGATNPVEYFSSDGPRRIFYNAAGTAITPGNFSSTGGQVLLKPDFTAADGVATTVTSPAGFNPFYGTSAAAPHAAAIAALIKSYNPALTPAQIRTMLSSTALDIAAAGYDRDSGSGIVMALQAIQASPTSPDVLTVTGTSLDPSALPGGPFSPLSTVYTLTNNGLSSLNWTAAKTQSWVTLSSAGGTLAAGASVGLTVSLTGSTLNTFSVGLHTDTVTITNTTSGSAQNYGLTVTVLIPPPANDNFANAILLTGTSAHPVGVDTTNATKEAGEPNHAGDTGGHSVWWKWVAPGSGTVVVDTFPSAYDTLLGVYTGSAVNSLTTIASNDDAPGMGEGIPSYLTFTAVAGTTYYVAVDGWEGATGIATLDLYMVKPINDFNADTKADIIWQNTTTGDRGFYMMNGTTFSSWVDIGVTATVWHIAATGDFNGDNKPDILWENTSTGDRGFWLMNGTTFSSWVDIGVITTDLKIVACADFNNDGKTDIVWENTVTGKRVIWLMNGTTFTSSVNLGIVSTDWHITGAADFNADGMPDLVWENTVTGDRYIWLMNGTTNTSAVSLGNVSTAWHIAAVADFNADLKPDLLWENTSTGDRGFYLMNGTAFSSWVYMGNVTTDWRIAP